MFETLMTMLGFDGLGIGTIVTLIIGACIGWCVPQPVWIQPLTEMVCKRFGLERFHREGHQHSDEHEDHEEDHKK
jgi:hypothetical protein